MTNTMNPAPVATVGTTFKACTVLSAIGFASTAAMAVDGHTVNTFMWVRGALLPVVAVLLYRLPLAAAAGSDKALDRLRTLTVVMPVAIVAVDLVPGLCPPWYAALQTVGMVPVIVAAVTLRRTR
jgi:hypothetical protein